MTDHSRIDALRRRVQQDPASIAFAQLAEELRRAGQIDEAVATCRAGLAIHPTYLSARVTLGRALIECDLDAAQREMERVLASAADNLAAIRALGDIHHRRGALDASLERYRTALELAPNDPDLELLVATLSCELEDRAAAAAALEQPQLDAPQAEEPRPQDPELAAAAAASPPDVPPCDDSVLQLPMFPPNGFDSRAFDVPFADRAFEPVVFDAPAFEAFVAEAAAAVEAPAADAPVAVSFVSESAGSDHERLARTVAELESWLDAIHVARAVHRA